MKIRIKPKVLKHQHDFIVSEAKHPALVSGYGGGKTHAFILKAIQEHLRPENRGKRGLIAEPTVKMLQHILIPEITKTLRAMGVKYEHLKSLSMIRTPYGEIILHSAENYMRWAGLNLAWGGIDEAALLKDEQAWNMLLSRLRDRGTLTGFITTTPEGKNWVFEKWVKNPKNGYVLYKARSTDNPFLPEEFILSLKQNYPKKLLNQYLNGEFVTLQGNVFDMYSERNIDDWEYQPGLETFFCMDFGYNRPSVLLGQEDYLGRIHIFEEFPDRNIKTFDLALKMKDRAIGLGFWEEGETPVYCDPAGTAHTSSADYSDVAILRQLGFKPIYTTSAMLRRIKTGVTIIQMLLENSLGEVRLFINKKNCPNLDSSLTNYQYDDNGEPLKDGVNDHDIDALRYFVIHRFGVDFMLGRGVE